MRKLTTAALLVGGAILACQPGFAQTFVANDLYMGFQNSADATSPGDYIINLGSASSIIGGTSVLNLSSDFSLSDFNSVLNGSTSMMGGGVVGASSQFQAWDMFATQVRVGGAGNPALPGSSLASLGDYGYSQDSGGATALSTLNGPAVGTGVVDSGKSWQGSIESTPANPQTTGTFWSASGVQPDTSIGDGSVVYEDLWTTSTTSATVKNPWVYVGYFTLNTGNTPSLTFTPMAVPEPSVLGLLGGASLLALSFRRRLSRFRA